MSVKNMLREIVQDPKIASMVSTMTTGAGLAAILDLIPNNIGKLATLVGVVLSLVLIYTHWRKGRIEYKKIQLEIDLLKKNQEKQNPESRIFIE